MNTVRLTAFNAEHAMSFSGDSDAHPASYVTAARENTSSYFKLTAAPPRGFGTYVAPTMCSRTFNIFLDTSSVSSNTDKYDIRHPKHRRAGSFKLKAQSTGKSKIKEAPSVSG